jgi:hypothetical protein
MKTIITKLDQIRSTSIGHQQKCCGTGIHRNWKKQPKGGRGAAKRKALAE